MIYVTYNNKALNDGLGAQAQRILSIYMICKMYGWTYIHSPIITNRENIDQNIVRQFNQLIGGTEFPLSPPLGCTVEYQECLNVESLLKKSDIFVYVTFAHNFMDNLSLGPPTPFPCKFEWISDTLDCEVNGVVTISVHIRRGDVSTTQNSCRYVNISFYRLHLLQLVKILEQNNRQYKIDVYSEGKDEDFTDLDVVKCLTLHINENICDTFKALVNADVLMAGFSSLSYSASLLRQKGCVLHPPFWHKYSKINSLQLKRIGSIVHLLEILRKTKLL